VTNIREASFGCMDDVEILEDTLTNIITAGWRPASNTSGWPTSEKPPLATRDGMEILRDTLLWLHG
jgi:hypothetical protein